MVGGGGCGKFGCLGRRRTEKGFQAVRLLGKKWENGKQCDLKNYSRWPKIEYVRTSVGTFDHTRAVAWVCVCVMRSNLCKQVRMHVCSTVHV
jgi:hypothetical protein